MQSMTGFGRGSATWNGRVVIVEIKSVNHRYLELRVRAPKEMLAAEAAIEQRLRRALSRGYCTVSLDVEGAGQQAVKLNTAALRATMKELDVVAAESGLTLRDLVPILSQMPELFSAPTIDPAESYLPAVESACDKAISQLLQSRAVEGSTIAQAMRPLIASIGKRTNEVRALAALCPIMAKQRLEARIGELVKDQTILDNGRLEQEVALLSDRADITEELSRLEAHLLELERLQATDVPIGRRVEFLLQEIGRETNTMGSKAAMQRISSCVIDIKSDLDKLRELVANVE